MRAGSESVIRFHSQHLDATLVDVLESVVVHAQSPGLTEVETGPETIGRADAALVAHGATVVPGCRHGGLGLPEENTRSAGQLEFLDYAPGYGAFQGPAVDITLYLRVGDIVDRDTRLILARKPPGGAL